MIAVGLLYVERDPAHGKSGTVKGHIDPESLSLTAPSEVLNLKPWTTPLNGAEIRVRGPSAVSSL